MALRSEEDGFWGRAIPTMSLALLAAAGYANIASDDYFYQVGASVMMLEAVGLVCASATGCRSQVMCFQLCLPCFPALTALHAASNHLITSVIKH